MKKLLFIPLIAAFLYSCEEVPVMYDNTARGTDTTYIAPIESKQEKMYLVEEFSGVRCINCPAGTDMLNEINSSGEFKNKLIIASIHAGDLTAPLTKEGHISIQDFRTEAGLQILNGIFGGDPGKPCAGFDRLPLAISGGMEGKILDFRGNWETMLLKAKETNGNAPANIHISSDYIGDNTYKINIKIAYTEEIKGAHALTVYILENDIVDQQMFPSKYDTYTFQHVFRTAITPWNGLVYLKDIETKEAGRVFEQTLYFVHNPSDAQQSFWKPENMEILAFIHSADADDKKVFQSAKKHLK